MDDAVPYDEIYMMLFTHGTDFIGLTSIQEWRTVLDLALQRGSFIGILLV